MRRYNANPNKRVARRTAPTIRPRVIGVKPFLLVEETDDTLFELLSVVGSEPATELVGAAVAPMLPVPAAIPDGPGDGDG